MAINPPTCNVSKTGKTVQVEGLALYEGRAQTKLYYFYQPKCSKCQEFQPEWKKIVSALRGSDIGAIPVNTSTPDNLPLVSYYNIAKTPTLILVDGYQSTEYEGPNTAQSVLAFVRGDAQLSPTSQTY
jgi:thiol-disulfide isomerase/thioredoxin